jgi:hypothetical protein
MSNELAALRRPTRIPHASHTHPARIPHASRTHPARTLQTSTSVLRQLVNRIYRDRDYLDRRKREGRHTAYDYAVDRDLKALALAIRGIVRYTPAEEKARPEPPKPPRKPSRRLSAAERAKTAARPSWNGQPKRDWTGPDLPPRLPRRGSAAPRVTRLRGVEERR